MFTKTLIFTVSCCAAVFANETPKLYPDQIGAEIQIRFQKVNEKAQKFFGNVKNTWKTFWDRLTGRESKNKQDKINALKAELSKQQHESNDALVTEKSKWQAKLAAQEAELEKLRDDKYALARAQERLKELEERAVQAISAVVDNWDKEVTNLGAKIERALVE